MALFANMFLLPIIAQSVKNGVDIPRSSTGAQSMMARFDVSWPIKHATLPCGGGGFDPAIFASF